MIIPWVLRLEPPVFSPQWPKACVEGKGKEALSVPKTESSHLHLHLPGLLCLQQYCRQEAPGRYWRAAACNHELSTSISHRQLTASIPRHTTLPTSVSRLNNPEPTWQKSGKSTKPIFIYH